MLNITNYRGNANQNHNKVSLHTSQHGHRQKVYKQYSQKGCAEKGRGNSYTIGGDVHWLQSLWKTVWEFLQKLKTELPYYPAIPLLSTYLEKQLIQKDKCIPMLIAALFTRAKTWKQLKCPSTDEWIKKMYYIHIMKCYSVNSA